MTIGIIYRAFDTTNGKSYIGQTWYSLRQRSTRHNRDALSGRGRLPFHRSLKAHGIENFVWSILIQLCDQKSLDEAEIAFIKELESEHPHGYNMTEGGKGGRMTDETKEKMSKSHLGKVGVWSGKNLSSEHRERISKSMMGRECSAETSAKRSSSLREYWAKRRTSL